ncbi:MAG: 50S ribosomal protein L23 [Candidatus Saccharibacteria bacterium]
MSIIDKIIPGNDGDKKPKKEKKEENVLDLVKEEKAEKKQPVALKEDTGTAHRILRQYHLSEKTNALSTVGRYVFKVDRRANKIEVKKAVEKVYDVHVTDVNMVSTKGKSRRYGRKTGFTSDWKKAIVTLKDGEKISGLTEGV